MEVHRITFVNPSFSPRPSFAIVRANSETGAVQQFRKETNQACVIQTIGDRGVVRVERVKGDA